MPTPNNFDKCLTELLKHEGGFVNHPRDPGGMTNLGVTKATYEAWVKHPISEKVMRGLTPSLVHSLYKVKYWQVVNADKLPLGVDLCVFDFAVNAGPRRAAKYLQTTVGATPDGVVGAGTLARVSAFTAANGVSGLVDAYQDSRETYYRKLRTFGTFGRGWLRRVKEVRAAAQDMAR